MVYWKVLSFICAIFALLVWVVAPVCADEELPVVHAVLFYSPNCPHCHTVIAEVLPPLFEQYAKQLQIVGVDTYTSEGSDLYHAAIEYFQIPEERRGVPTLIIGDVVLVGSGEIPEQLPDLIEQGLAAGGVDWPAILNSVPPATATPEAVVTPVPTNSVAATPLPSPTIQQVTPTPGLAFPTDSPSSIGEIIARDMPGNVISIGILCGMVLSVGYVVIDGARVLRTRRMETWKDGRSRRRREFRREAEPMHLPAWWDWAVLGLCVLGLIVAGYLAYVETTLTEAVCGPVGDCNAVQQSEYVLLFGLIPIALFGLAGYVVILAVWAFGKFGRGRLAELSPVGLLGLALFGTAFSIYLTFLEPFVIGATCSWCLTSAVGMTLVLLLVARPGWETLRREWSI
jgi:uncharacterized membrane protein/thiol-disulfide isomerase/thioredoxin